jgi:hypothetical protein
MIEKHEYLLFSFWFLKARTKLSHSLDYLLLQCWLLQMQYRQLIRSKMRRIVLLMNPQSSSSYLSTMSSHLFIPEPIRLSLFSRPVFFFFELRFRVCFGCICGGAELGRLVVCTESPSLASNFLPGRLSGRSALSAGITWVTLTSSA